MGIRKDTGNRPQGAQRCLKIAANRVGSVYRGAVDYPTCTELNKTSSILFNLAYCLKALLPAGIGGFMVADRFEEVKIEQNRNQFFSSGFSAKRESIFSSQRDCLHQPISIIKNPAMKIAVRAADAGEITQDATNPVPALVKK